MLNPGQSESMEFLTRAENILNEKTGVKEDRIDLKFAKMHEFLRKGRTF